MSAIDLLHAAHPFLPLDLAVGNSPQDYLKRLPTPSSHIASVAGYPIGAPINRAVLRQICLDPQVTPLAKYACIMAWGGQHFGNFDQSVLALGLEPLIQALLASANNRQIDFVNTQVASAAIPGLGISFYTKLLFFLRPIQDAYMLDQWTAKSILLLQFPPVIRLGPRGNNGFYRAAPNTTQAEYERFCQAVEALRVSLWQIGAPPTGEQVEMAMFDRSRPDGFWRGFVKINFKHPVAGSLFSEGAESLTQALDYRCGLLVIRRINPPRLFVIGIHGSCCHWSLDDCYRLLLARLRELLSQHGLPITLVLPPGPCPPWFTDALKALGITFETSEVGDVPSPAVESDDDDDMEPVDPGGSRSECEPQLQPPRTGPAQKETRSATEPAGSAPTEVSNNPPAKAVIYLQETGGKSYTKIINACGDRANLGLITKSGELWLIADKRPQSRYLIAEIIAAGGPSLPNDPRFRPRGGSTPVGGSGFQGGVALGSIDQCRKFLEQWFLVRDCQ